MNTEKIKAKESKQLTRLNKTNAKGSYKGDFFVLLCLIAIVNILDEVTSNLTVTVQSSFVTEFFVNNPFLGKFYTFQEGLALHSTIGIFTYVLGIITPFYKALADKETKTLFGGRLAEYRYYDMDAVIASALKVAEKEFN